MSWTSYVCHVLIEVCVSRARARRSVCARGVCGRDMRVMYAHQVCDCVWVDAYEVIWVRSAYGARGHVFRDTPTHSTRPGCLLFFLVDCLHLRDKDRRD